MHRRGKVLLVIAFLMCLLINETSAQQTVEVPLAAHQQALLPVVISSDATDATRDLAQELIGYLNKISGATFELKTGNSNSGIVIGTITEFPQFKSTFPADDVHFREAYLLRSHANGVYLIGATPRGLQHAVWDFLHLLGYRQYFPGRHWEIIPQIDALKIAVDKVEKPDYLQRDFFFNYGTWPDNAERFQRWQHVNRLGKSFSLNTGHAWDNMVSQHKKEFEAHPEYFALVKGKRQTQGQRRHLCLSNAAVRDIFVRYVLDYFKKNPEQDSVSIEPTDSGSWCECEHCAALGSPSDRMVLLANQVVHEVRKKYPKKYVAFYAYSYHAAGPTKRLDPGTIVSVTTALRKSKESLADIIAAWKNKGATIGIRDYGDIYSWEAFGVPFYNQASRIDDYVAALKSYPQEGKRFYRSEMSDNWATSGLGYYIAARITWDAAEADNIDAIIDEFLDNSFGKASPTMRRFYGLTTGIDNTWVPPFDEFYIKQLYELLQTAWNETDDTAVKLRLSDLILYVHYLENYLYFLNASGEAQQKYFEELVQYTYRLHPTHMSHSRAIYRTAFRNKFGAQGSVPAEATYKIDEDENPWKFTTPFSEAEVLEFLKEGVQMETPSFIKDVQLQRFNQKTPAKSTFYTRGRVRLLLQPVQEGKITILPSRLEDGIYNYPRSYVVRDAANKVIQSGVARDGEPITFAGRAGHNYEFYLFMSDYSSSHQFDVTGAAAAIQTNLEHGGLHHFRDPRTYYITVPPHAKEWTLQLKTLSPAETAKVTVTSPDAAAVYSIDTIAHKEQQLRLPAQAGRWKIYVAKAASGTLYSTLITIDPQIPKWVSVSADYAWR